MIKRFIIPGVAAGLAFACAANAQQVSQPLSSPSAAIITRKVLCRDLPSVPMTADSFQSLPLQVTAMLACGEEVTPLSSLEGYIVQVRRADGKIGYVARLYLTAVTRPAPVAKTEPAHPLGSAKIENGIARWQPGGLGCEQFLSGEGLIESLTVNGVTVQASLQDTGWKFRALVAVANHSADKVEIVPANIGLDLTAPAPKSLAWNDPAVLAKRTSHQVLWTSSTATAPPVAESASYKIPFVTHALPNYYGQEQSSDPNAGTVDNGFNTAKQILGIALHPGSVAPKNSVSGAVWFDRDKKAQELVLHVPVGEVTYEFPLSFQQKK